MWIPRHRDAPRAYLGEVVSNPLYLQVILQRLDQSFAMSILTNDDKETQAELQGLLCGTLQVRLSFVGLHIRNGHASCGDAEARKNAIAPDRLLCRS